MDTENQGNSGASSGEATPTPVTTPEPVAAAKPPEPTPVAPTAKVEVKDGKVTVDGKLWGFPSYCLSSGGSVWFDDEWSEHVEDGEWSITEWPEGFPEELKSEVESAVQAEIPNGCCGGCV